MIIETSGFGWGSSLLWKDIMMATGIGDIQNNKVIMDVFKYKLRLYRFIISGGVVPLWKLVPLGTQNNSYTLSFCSYRR